MDAVAEAVSPLGGGSVLGYANMLTYRNKDVMLSSVQEYHGLNKAFFHSSRESVGDPVLCRWTNGRPTASLAGYPGHLQEWNSLQPTADPA